MDSTKEGATNSDIHCSHVENLPYTVLTNNPSIASINDPSRFGHLPSGYLVHDTAISVQLAFFRHPYFDPNSKWARSVHR